MTVNLNSISTNPTNYFLNAALQNKNSSTSSSTGTNSISSSANSSNLISNNQAPTPISSSTNINQSVFPAENNSVYILQGILNLAQNFFIKLSSVVDNLKNGKYENQSPSTSSSPLSVENIAPNTTDSLNNNFESNPVLNNGISGTPSSILNNIQQPTSCACESAIGNNTSLKDSLENSEILGKDGKYQKIVDDLFSLAEKLLVGFSLGKGSIKGIFNIGKGIFKALKKLF